MAQKTILSLVWLGFVVYAFILAPPNKPAEDTLELLINLSTGQWSAINPMIVAIFCIMGILPWVYGAFILFDSPGQKISAYPFFIGSFGLGAFALLPYLILRQPNSTWESSKGRLLKVLDSPIAAVSFLTTVVVFLFWAVSNGSWSNFVGQWQSDRFINVMSLDFCILSLLLPLVLADDLKRRGLEKSGYLWLAIFLPLLGSLIYWCWRPQLPIESITEQKLIASRDDPNHATKVL